jgi:FkbM family methyltransferase
MTKADVLARATVRKVAKFAVKIVGESAVYRLLLSAARFGNARNLKMVARTAHRGMAILEHRVPEFPTYAPYAGRRLHFPSRSMIGQLAARGEIWDVIIVKVLGSTHIVPTSIVEVGSNIGASLLPLLQMFPDAKAIAIEPSRRYAPYLRRSVSAHHSVTIIDDVLLGATDGDKFVLRTNHTTGTASNADYGGHFTGEEVVQSKTLDTLLDDLEKSRGQIFAVDFLKVDTDGFEMDVFQGAVRSIKQYKPLIFLEFSPRHLARLGDPAAFLEFLRGELMCKDFLVLSDSGNILGWAETYEDILKLEGEDYYVNLFTAPSGSSFLAPLKRFVKVPNAL